MRVGADKGIGRAVHVGKVAAPATRYTNFFARRFCVIDDKHRPARMGGAHHTGGSGTKDHCGVMHGTRFAPQGATRQGRAGGGGFARGGGKQTSRA